MYKPNYGEPNLGKNVSIVGGANFCSEPYIITIGDNCIIAYRNKHKDDFMYIVSKPFE